MKHCAVEIVTHTDGEKSRFYADGDFEEGEDGFSVFYEEDGDRVSLTVRGDVFFMEREGMLSAEFRPKKQTAFIFRTDDSAAEIPVFTAFCSAIQTREGYRIVLKYRLLFPQNSKKFSLTINIKINSEEK